MRMTQRRGSVQGTCLVVAATIAVLAALVALRDAEAASNVQVAAVDCRGHPRRIAIKNLGDTAQDLAGWRLESDQPDEVFDLSPVGILEAGATVYVFNGHLAPATPTLVGGAWVYPWNPGSFDWALYEDGQDFIRIVDAAQLPWRSVSEMPCPGTAEIPPLEQPTPTPPPNPNPGSTDPGAPQGNQVDDTQTASTQTGDTQSSEATRNVAAANSALGGGAAATAQTGNVSGQAPGAPASGAGLLSGSSGAPLTGHLLLSLLSVVASAGLALLGLRMLHRPQRRP